MADLLTATLNAVFANLKAAIQPQLASVFDVIPQGTQPNFVAIGHIDAENQLEGDAFDDDDQLEKITFEVQYIYRGNDRRVLLAMMDTGRSALHGKPISADGVAFGLPKFITGSASTAGPDGVTYAALGTFVVLAQPA